MSDSATSDTDSALACLRSRRLAKEAAAREEHAQALAKQREQAAENRRALLAKFDQIDRAIAEIRRQLTVNEKSLTAISKSRSVLAHQPPRPALTSWSPEGLAVALADMSPAELEKLRQ
jgi:hypothetical protein